MRYIGIQFKYEKSYCWSTQIGYAHIISYFCGYSQKCFCFFEER